MKIIKNKYIDPEMWNLYAQDNIFHRYEWKWIIEKAYGLEPNFILAVQDENFALIPSFCVNKCNISLPFTYISGYLTNSEKLFLKFKKILDSDEQKFRYKVMQDNNPEVGLVTAIIEINNINDYFTKLSRNMRNQLRNSEKQGFKFEKQKDIKHFYPLYCKKMHELGTPPHKKIFFKEIMKYFNSAQIFTVFKDNISVASLLYIDGKGIKKKLPTRYLLYAASESQKDAPYANYFAYWHMIKDACMYKHYQVDLGTTQFGSNHYSFKKKWRPKIYQITEIGNTKKHYKERPYMIFASYIWKKLPSFFVNFFGPHIRKHLP